MVVPAGGCHVEYLSGQIARAIDDVDIAGVGAAVVGSVGAIGS
jgi:hypothetical protein